MKRFLLCFIVAIGVISLLTVNVCTAQQTKKVPLEEQVKIKILQNKQISIKNLKVTYEGNGEIKLEGTTDLYASSHLAAVEAVSIDGVNFVDNNIEVIHVTEKTDAEIQKEIQVEVKKIIKEDAMKNISIRVKDGSVDIQGTSLDKEAINKIYDRIIWIPGIIYVRKGIKEAK